MWWIGCWISEQLWGKYLKLTCLEFLEKWSKSDNDSGCHLGSSCHRCFVELLSWHLSDAQQWLIVLVFFKPPFLILGVTMDQTSPVLELKWHRASVNPRDFPPTTHHSQCTQANGTSDPLWWSSPALQEQLIGALVLGNDSLYIMPLCCSVLCGELCWPTVPHALSRG